MNEIPEIPNPLSSAKVIGADIENAVYLRNSRRGDPDYVMSRSELVEFSRCPSRWIAGYRDGATKEKDWGSLIDCLLLQPAHYQKRFAVCPETYPDAKTTEPKEWTFKANYCKAWRDERKGMSIVTAADDADARSAVSKLVNDPDVAGMIATAQRQVFIMGEYHDNETGLVIPVKCLIDIVPGLDSEYPKALADLKTAASASGHAWKRAVFDHGYHIQAALSLDLYTLATGEDRCEFRHIIQENYAPWQIGKRLLDDEFITLGRIAYRGALSRYAQCIKRNDWPGYEASERETLRGWGITKPEAWMVQ